MTVQDERVSRQGWAVHPGEHLAEHLEARELSQAEFARLAGLTPKLVSTIIAGKNPVTAETAVRFERVLGLKAYIWVGLQAAWDLQEERRREFEHEAMPEAWLKGVPLSELQRRGALPITSDSTELTNAFLGFLGIGSPRSFVSFYSSLAVHYRRSRSYSASDLHVACWLRLGELRVAGRSAPSFDREKFRNALSAIRKLTVARPEDFEPRLKAECERAGVFLVFEKPLPKTSLYGSARWLPSGNAMIQMSLRMRTNDHFWWTFFHEAGHVLLHQGCTFVDDEGGDGSDLEKQADEFAEELLVGRERFRRFVELRPRSATQITTFANDVGIAPGIIVGMLQHVGAIPYRNLNGLKVRLGWSDE
ncbi:MAG: HigA family addiction module antitoxin [Bauldia sp.]